MSLPRIASFDAEKITMYTATEDYCAVSKSALCSSGVCGYKYCAASKGGVSRRDILHMIHILYGVAHIVSPIAPSEHVIHMKLTSSL